MQASVVLGVLGLLMSQWINEVNGIKNQVKLINGEIQQGLVLDIEKTARMLAPLNQSTVDLGRFLSSSMATSELKNFSAIQTRVSIYLSSLLLILIHLNTGNSLIYSKNFKLSYDMICYTQKYIFDHFLVPKLIWIIR